MNFSEEDIEKLRPRVRFKVCYDVGFYCPDVDDIVQETLTRFLVATREEKIHNLAARGCIRQRHMPECHLRVPPPERAR
jgi:DNA-directed RNA polymerase specialized sigma24 family protein